MAFQVHSFMQNADDFDANGSLFAVKDEVLTCGKFAVPGTDLVTTLALLRVFCQSMETAVQQGKVVTALASPPMFLSIATSLAQILKGLLCQ